MRRMFKKFILSVMISAGFMTVVLAQNIPARPQGYVSDFARILSVSDENRMTALCTELERKTGAQIAVVTMPSVQPDTVEQYAVKLFKKWGIGQKGKDNGVLLLVAVNDRKARIEVGYGLEGSLTDALSKSIIERFMVPAFRQGNFPQGIQAGATAVASVIAKEYGVTVTGREQQVYQALQQSERRKPGVGQVIMLIIMLILFIRNPRLFFYMMMN